MLSKRLAAPQPGSKFLKKATPPVADFLTLVLNSLPDSYPGARELTPARVPAWCCQLNKWSS